MAESEYTLARTGHPPLRFAGELLAQADGQRVNGQEQTRWHELAVYRTPAANYVVAITLRSQWAGESDHFSVATSADPAAVHAVLQDYDPTEHLQGYPAGPTYAAKQARLEADIQRRYEALAVEVYERLGAEFAEVLP